MPTPVPLEMLNIWLWLTRDFLIVESTVTVQVKFYSRFKLFFGEITDTCDELLDRYSRTGRPLGDERFVSRRESLTGAALALKRPGRRSKGADK